MFESLSIYIALAPLAVYVVLIGMMNLSRRPVVVVGRRDLVALFVAMTGLVVVGPMEALFPLNAAWNYGVWVWLALLAIYACVVFLIVMAHRPSLNLYNITAEELRPALSSLAVEIDSGSRWAGDSLSIPALGIHLYLEKNAVWRNVSLMSAGGQQNLTGWRQLAGLLTAKLRAQMVPINPSRRNVVGIVLLAVGLVALVALHLMVWLDSAAFLKAIPDLLRI